VYLRFFPKRLHPELTSLLDEARRTFDREKQRELYSKAQRIIQDNHPLTFLLYHDAAVAVWKWVKAYKPTPVMTPFLREVDIET
jgi:ABC-type transport system substrate-binding protein